MTSSSWIAVTMKNKTTGQSIRLYHPPGNCEEVDRKLRYAVLELPEPDNSPITITALHEGAEWVHTEAATADS